MCELFGISAGHDMEANAWLRTFFTHSAKNPHGWGLAVFYPAIGQDAGQVVTIEKEPVRADRSAYLQARLERGVRASTLIAHIREATIGALEYRNTHPFIRRDSSGRCWTLAHNGTLFDDSAVHRYMGIQDGQTDSERVLLYLIDRIDQALALKCEGGTPSGPFSNLIPHAARRCGTDSGFKNNPSGLSLSLPAPDLEDLRASSVQEPGLQGTALRETLVGICGRRKTDLSAQERCRIVDDAVRALAPENKLNLLLYDGEILYAHTNMRGTLHQCRLGGARLFATVPFPAGNGEAWEEVPFTSLCAYQNGRQIYRGAPHGHEYIPDPEKLRSLWMAYSGL